ncbi:MAG TPA: hypothetical protein VFO79_12265, partial [Xanthomonadales bacterium]|nr:hypothetical protein [Xanthomonadales bacterium]
MNFSRYLATALAVAVLAPGMTCPRVASAADPAARAEALPATIDAIAQRWIDRGVVGMSIAIVRGDDVLVSKGYGRAHVEFDVPTPENAVYEIGS